MSDQYLTAQDMDKFGKAPRRIYIEKQGFIQSDIPSEGRNKRYSYQMGFKWGFISYFDSIYNINTANSITENIMNILPQIVSRGCDRVDGERVWLVILDNKICFSGLSYNEEYTPQPEEQENLMKFTIFSAQYFPGWDIDIWTKPNPYTMPPKYISGGGAGLIMPQKKDPPKFVSRQTTLARSLSIHCISDIFDGIAVKFGVNPYELPVDDFRQLVTLVEEINIEDLIFKIN